MSRGITLKFPLNRTVFAVASLALAVACVPAEDGGPGRTGTGALIGAAGGALVGQAIGSSEEERRRGAAIGALVGAGVGAAVGHNLDQQARELRSSMDSRVQIINQGDYLIVRMPQDILFAVDSYAVGPTLQGDLGDLARSLQRYPNSTVEVVGHTDNTGSASYNQTLSERRAQAVAQVLVGYGVLSSRLRAYGRGETQPIASNLTVDGRAKNRRVDIFIRPN